MSYPCWDCGAGMNRAVAYCEECNRKRLLADELKDVYADSQRTVIGLPESINAEAEHAPPAIRGGRRLMTIDDVLNGMDFVSTDDEARLRRVLPELLAEARRQDAVALLEAINAAAEPDLLAGTPMAHHRAIERKLAALRRGNPDE